jgi:hypothetical protein
MISDNNSIELNMMKKHKITIWGYYTLLSGYSSKNINDNLGSKRDDY